MRAFPKPLASLSSSRAVSTRSVACFGKWLKLRYLEGRDFVIEYRWVDGNYNQLPSLLDDLIRLKVDVIVTGTPGVLAAKRATTTIPIVCAVVGDALGSGIVSSLARPGGNVTG